MSDILNDAAAFGVWMETEQINEDHGPALTKKMLSVTGPLEQFGDDLLQVAKKYDAEDNAKRKMSKKKQLTPEETRAFKCVKIFNEIRAGIKKLEDFASEL